MIHERRVETVPRRDGLLKIHEARISKLNFQYQSLAQWMEEIFEPERQHIIKLSPKDYFRGCHREANTAQIVMFPLVVSSPFKNDLLLDTVDFYVYLLPSGYQIGNCQSF